MAIQKDFIIKNGLEVKNNLIVADSTIERVGIGTSVINEKLQVLGGIGATNITISGIGTIPTLRSTNAYIGTTYSNAGIITSLSGIGATYSIANFGIVGVNTLNAVGGIVTTISGTNAYYTNTFVTNEYVSNIFGVSGIVTTLNGTTLRYNTANIEQGNIVSGVVTTIRGTNLNYSGIGTITTSKATTLLATNGYINAGVVTSISGTDLNYSGVGTITTSKATTLLATNAYVNSGVVTAISGTDLNYSGIGTIGGVKIQSGIITATNSGFVTYYGDGRYLKNVTSGVGLSTELGIVGYGATILNLTGPGISSVSVGSGIGTIFVVSSRWTTGTGDDIYRLSGDVGINTANPQFTLDVNGDINFTGIFYQNGSQFVASRWTAGTGDDIYRLSGDVGIGTTNPMQRLDVVGGSIRTSGQFISTVTTGTAPLSVTSTTVVTNLNADLLDGIDSGSFLRSDAADQKTSGTLTFNDNIILSFGTGDDAEFFCDGTDLYLDLNSTGVASWIIRDGTTNRFTFARATGNFTATGTVTANSDEKLKTNIKTIENALEKVSSIRGVEFDRTDIGEHQIGVIAQEVEKVIPEVVYGDETKSVAYGNLVGLLIEAIKEQQVRIEKLEKELYNK